MFFVDALDVMLAFILAKLIPAKGIQLEVVFKNSQVDTKEMQ